MWRDTLDASYLLMTLLTLVIGTALSSSAESDGSAGYQLPKHDGVRRIVTLESKNFQSFTTKEHIVIILYILPFDSKDQIAKKNWEMNANMLEMAAQLMKNRGIAVGAVNMMDHFELVKKNGVKTSGTVHIYFHGKKIDYLGHRAPEILIPFLLKLQEDPVTVIVNKINKKTYDSADSSKLVAYFENRNVAGFKVFKEAAVSLQPFIQTFAVFDKKMAGKLKLKTPGSIHFHKMFQKNHIVVPAKAGNSANGIVSFIEKNKQPVIKKVTMEDMTSSLTDSKHEHLIMAFARSSSREDKPFFRLLKTVAQNSMAKNSSLFIFVWIDPDTFPSSMVDYWKTNFKVDTSHAALGLVNLTSASSSSEWFDMSRLKKGLSENSKVKLLQAWLDDIKNGKIKLKSDTQTASADQEGSGKTSPSSDDVKKDESDLSEGQTDGELNKHEDKMIADKMHTDSVSKEEL